MKGKEKMDKKHISSGAAWESIVGYSRAVRTGNLVFVSGTTSLDSEGKVVAQGDAYGQARQALEIIAASLDLAGARLTDVVRTRMFVTDISLWEDFGRAHGEFFSKVKPAATMVEVRRLIHPDMLIEIEVDAVICD